MGPASKYSPLQDLSDSNAETSAESSAIEESALESATEERVRQVVEWGRFPPMSVWTEWLPEWAADKGALELSKSFHADQQTEHVREPISERCICGPALLWAFKGSAVLWGLSLLLPWITRPLSTCGSDGLAHYPMWLLAATGPFALFTFWCGWKAMGYVVCTQVQGVAPFKLMGINLSFITWFAAYSMLTFVGMYDIITNGLFLALVLETFSGCSGSHVYAELWHYTLSHSMIPGFLRGKFVYYALVSWSLTFVQLVFALSSTVPRKLCSPPDYSLKTIDDAERMAKGDKGTVMSTMYETLSVSRQNHGRAVQAIAGMARLEILTSPDPMCARAKIAFYMEIKGDHASAIRQLESLIRRFTQKILLSGILDNALQLTLQVSINAILSKVNGKVFATQTNLTVFTGFAGAMYLGFEAMQFRFWAGSNLSLIRRHLDDAIEKKTMDWKCADTPENIKANLYVPAVRMLYVLTGGLILYIAFVCFNMVKFAMVYLCEDSMWNVSGCVHLPVYMLDKIDEFVA